MTFNFAGFYLAVFIFLRKYSALKITSQII